MANTLNLLIMDPPYESANTMTAFRVIATALKKGHNVNVFAYEGAVGLTFVDQKAHANAVKGTSLEEEKHPVPKDMVAELFKLAKEQNTQLTWINCGLCVDERGVGRWVDGAQRGSPADFMKAVNAGGNTLVMGTK